MIGRRAIEKSRPLRLTSDAPGSAITEALVGPPPSARPGRLGPFSPRYPREARPSFWFLIPPHSTEILNGRPGLQPCDHRWEPCHFACLTERILDSFACSCVGTCPQTVGHQTPTTPQREDRISAEQGCAFCAAVNHALACASIFQFSSCPLRTLFRCSTPSYAKQRPETMPRSLRGHDESLPYIFRSAPPQPMAPITGQWMGRGNPMLHPASLNELQDTAGQGSRALPIEPLQAPADGPGPWPLREPENCRRMVRAL